MKCECYEEDCLTSRLSESAEQLSFWNSVSHEASDWSTSGNPALLLVDADSGTTRKRNTHSPLFHLLPVTLSWYLIGPLSHILSSHWSRDKMRRL